MAWTDPRTWAAGETVTAALLNTHVRDNFKALGDAWTAYTPAWTSTGTAPALGNGVIEGVYVQVGKLVIYRIELAMGGTTTFGTGQYRFSLPAASVTSDVIPAGQAIIRDASPAANAMRFAFMSGTTTVGLWDTAGTQIANTTPWTWANGDSIAIVGTYEAA